MTGEFVAEVGRERMRLKLGDSLLMPMNVPHAGVWRRILIVAQFSSIHPQDEWKQNGPRLRKVEFEKDGLTLFGGALSKEEINEPSDAEAITVIRTRN